MPDDQRQDPPNQDDQDDQNQSQPQNQGQGPQGDQQQQNPSGDAGKTGEQGNAGADDGDAGADLEAQLEAEKRKNLKLTKDLGRAEAEKVKAAGDKDAAKERDEARAENNKLKALMDGKFLVWSIDTDKKYQWQNAEDVRAFIKDDEINIDVDKGQIDGLDLALKRIAKEKPYLLVPKENDQQQQRGPSGAHPNGSKSGDVVVEQKRLGAKYKIPGYGTMAQKFM